METKCVLTDSFFEKMTRLDEGMEIQFNDFKFGSSDHAEWFGVKDKRTNRVYEYTLYFYPEHVYIAEPVKNEMSHIYQVRSKQIVMLFIPLLENELRKSPHFRIKYAMKKYNIQLGHSFLQTWEEYPVRVWELFKRKYSLFVTGFLSICFLTIFLLSFMVDNLVWKGINIAPFLSSIPLFYILNEIRLCKKEATKINNLMKLKL
jgi:hypothetical protein